MSQASQETGYQMPSLTLELGNQTLHVGPYSLLVFIDETGDDEFRDPAYPLFGLGGCAVIASEYSKAIDAPWKDLKAQYAPGVSTLHACEYREQLSAPGAIEAMGHFFQSGNFYRFVTLIPIHAQTAHYKPFRLCAVQTFNRLKNIAGKGPAFSDVVMIFEAGRDGQVMENFGDLGLAADGVAIPFIKLLAPKSAGLTGLEVADFVLHTAGTALRDELKTGRPSHKRKDCQAVFQAKSDISEYFRTEKVRAEQPS